jgi:Ca2+-binding EF-hand superfamily protein
MPAVMSDPSVQDRLKRRFQRWDSDSSGNLERSDFEREADAIARRMGENSGSPKAQQLKQALTGMFEAIAKDAGADPRGSISWKQYHEVARRWMESSEEPLRRQLRPMVEAVVGMADKNGNGMIERQEFAAWISAVGRPQSEAEDAFDRIDTDRSGGLSVDEVLQACVDFHLGRSAFELL